jgi:FKBP-type peptidyl-prolyl cis-trans isomerase
MNLLIGCDRCLFTKTRTGLSYRIEEKGKGPKPTHGQLLLIDLLYQTKDKEVLFNSNDNNAPVVVPYDDSLYTADGGIYEAISMLAKGDKYIFKIPAKTLLGDQFKTLAEKHTLQENTPLYLHMYLKDITTEEEFQKMEAEYYQAMIDQQKQQAAQQLPKDLEVINDYLKKNQINAFTTSSGLRYVIDQPGQGDNPQPGNTVKVNYIGKTLEGQVFDTNIVEEAQKHNLYDARRKYEPMTFQIGEGGMIEGFEEGIKLLKKQAKARLFIPSVLAYKDLELKPYIQPHANLIFEVELVDIITS